MPSNRIFSPRIQIVSPSTTQLIRRPVPQIEKDIGSAALSALDAGVRKDWGAVSVPPSTHAPSPKKTRRNVAANADRTRPPNSHGLPRRRIRARANHVLNSHRARLGLRGRKSGFPDARRASSCAGRAFSCVAIVPASPQAASNSCPGYVADWCKYRVKLSTGNPIRSGCSSRCVATPSAISCCPARGRGVPWRIADAMPATGGTGAATARNVRIAIIAVGRPSRRPVSSARYAGPGTGLGDCR